MNMNLDNIIGVNVKITNVINETVSGRIYSWNTEANTVTLLTNAPKNTGKQQQNTQAGALFSFKLVKISFIQTIEVIQNHMQSPSQAYLKKDPLKPHQVFTERVQKFIDDAVRKQSQSNQKTAEASV